MATHKLTETVETIVTRDSILSRAKGLMFTCPIEDEAHVFRFSEPKPRSFHMAFVFYPIDIIFIHHDTVVELKESFKPFTRHKTSSDVDIVVELPHGYIKEHGIKPTDTFVTQTH